MTGSNMPAAKQSFVGRSRILQTVRKAIRSAKPEILFLEGDAGIGKTMLLEAAVEQIEDLRVLNPPIIDFYDTRFHSHQGLEAAIANNLDPENKKGAFAQYWEQRKTSSAS